jgi:DNA (cytosine-5)-methyltransferase 1
VPLEGYDYIWASPPCQAHTSMRTMPDAKEHTDLIPATRARLVASGLPYTIENVVGAPLISPIMLCGTMFNLGCEDAELRRHRLFECSFPTLFPQCRHGQRSSAIGVYGGHLRNRRRRADSANRGVSDFNVCQGKKAMQIDWMTLAEMSQAIPPAYAEFIAQQAMKWIGSNRAEEASTCRS